MYVDRPVAVHIPKPYAVPTEKLVPGVYIIFNISEGALVKFVHNYFLF